MSNIRYPIFNIQYNIHYHRTHNLRRKSNFCPPSALDYDRLMSSLHIYISPISHITANKPLLCCAMLCRAMQYTLCTYQGTTLPYPPPDHTAHQPPKARHGQPASRPKKKKKISSPEIHAHHATRGDPADGWADG